MSPKPKIYSNDDLMDYKANLSTHKRGLIIKKKVSIATMLSWSKVSFGGVRCMGDVM